MVEYKFKVGDRVRVKKDQIGLRGKAIPTNFYWNDTFVVEKCVLIEDWEKRNNHGLKEPVYVLQIERTGETIRGTSSEIDNPTNEQYWNWLYQRNLESVQ